MPLASFPHGTGSAQRWRQVLADGTLTFVLCHHFFARAKRLFFFLKKKETLIARVVLYLILDRSAGLPERNPTLGKTQGPANGWDDL